MQIKYLAIIGVAAFISLITTAITQFGIVDQPKISSRINNNTQIMSITNEDKDKALDILMSDPFVGNALKNNDWSLVEAAAVLTDGNNQKVGVGIVIKFEPSIWIKGKFYDQTNSYTAKLWLGSLHAAVDLTQNKIIYLNEGIGKPVSKVPLNATLTRAEEVARSYKDVKELNDAEVYLLAIYDKLPNYEQVAIFRYTDQSQEVLVGIDLIKMTVIEELSGKVGGV